jgi:site-specific DNA-methyltransferase (adenine-specific)
MRYIGSKQKLLDRLLACVPETETGTLLDGFAGSGVVAEAFSRRFNVVACDILHACHAVTAARLTHQKDLTIDVDATLASLNGLDEVAGFITATFTPVADRMYFTEENGRKIDAIRAAIESYTGADHTFLLGCLVESVSLVANTSGTYGAYNKSWDPRALNPFVLKNPFTLETSGIAVMGLALDVIRTTPHEILYLDPPYNKRQYGSYYHVIETLVRNDAPAVHGKTGIRDWSDTKSKFCNRDSALQELRDIVSATSASRVILSYNNEGLMTKDEMMSILREIGDVTCDEIPHPRYSAAAGETASKTVEYIFTAVRTAHRPPAYVNTVFREDCLVGMQRLPDASIDMILTDLPYGLTECKWDSVIPLPELWAQYKRVIKPDGAIVLFGQQPFTSTLVASNPQMFKYSLVWKKTKTGNFAQAPYRFLSEHEDIVVFSFGKTAKNGIPRMKYNPQGTTPCNKPMKGKTGSTAHRQGRGTQADYVQTVTNYPRSILEFASEGSPSHPTQKPIALCEYLIRTFTNPSDLVLDSCMGSGSTAVACRNTDRAFVGFETDPTYHALCMERVGKPAVREEAEPDRVAK